MESRIHGDVYVRFGGERLETYRPKGRQGALRLACGSGESFNRRQDSYVGGKGGGGYGGGAGGTFGNNASTRGGDGTVVIRYWAYEE